MGNLKIFVATDAMNLTVQLSKNNGHNWVEAPILEQILILADFVNDN